MKSTVGAAARLIAALLLAVLSIIVFGMSSASAGSAATASKVPFTDPQQDGYITLCNKNNQMVSSGSTLTVPFAWKAVSSSAAPQRYQKVGLETLFAYQPIQYVAAGDWSGEQLSGSTHFSNGQHPVAVSVPTDTPLVSFAGAYPPHWDGLVELRMYLTGPNLPEYASTYPAAVVRIDGTRWTMLAGNKTPCSAGTGESADATVLGTRSTQGSGSTAKLGKGNAKGSAAPFGAGTAGSGSSTPAARSVTADSTSQPQGAPRSTPAASATSTSGGGSSSTKIAGAVAVIILTLIAGFYVTRRRSAGRSL